MKVLLSSSLVLVTAFAAAQELSKTELQKRLKDTDVHASWIYDDIDAALAEGKKSGKPILAVFRCVP